MPRSNQPPGDEPRPEDPTDRRLSDLIAYAQELLEYTSTHQREANDKRHPLEMYYPHFILIQAIDIIRAARSDEQSQDPVAYLRLQLVRVARVKQLAELAERALTVDGVLAGEISRKTASEILGVHQVTVARWVNDFKAGNQSRFPLPAWITPAAKYVADETIDPEDD